MFYKKHYYYFKGALSEKLCDDIVERGMDDNPITALTGGYSTIIPRTKKEEKEVFDKRDYSVSWIDEAWVKKELQPYIDRANRLSGWNFDIEDSEPCQFTIYNEGQYYGWHTDSSGGYYETERMNGLIRKLSVTVSLSHPHEYEGGMLEFNTRRQDEPDDKSEIIKCKEILPRGSICVFPSYTHHRVSPVTKGRRLSLVQWNLGKEWR